MERVRDALVAAGAESVTFSARIDPSGRTRLRVRVPSAAVESGPAAGSALLLVEGAVAEPWRRQPTRFPDMRPARSADRAALERWLLRRPPGAAGAREKEIRAAEARLGLTLADELASLYRVVGDVGEGRGQDTWSASEACDVIGFELFPLDDVYVADSATRPAPWVADDRTLLRMDRAELVSRYGALLQEVLTPPVP
ncbi:hypothetical protein [Streptomyces althioticus]|uniref:hypothetical protein n=1 Tax=Streptomyces althioticus TaxID=83380 RepID=UPI0033F34D5F